MAPRDIIYTVDSPEEGGDAIWGDGECATSFPIVMCTLRTAVEEASHDGAPSRIVFNNKMLIVLATGLFLGEDNTTIDASGVWDSVNNRPGIRLRADYTKPAGGGWLIDGVVSNTALYGLWFEGQYADGVRLTGSNNTIGGTGGGQRNAFTVGNNSILLTTISTNNTVAGNYVGTYDGVSIPIWGVSGCGICLENTSSSSIHHNRIGNQDYGIKLTSQPINDPSGCDSDNFSL